MVLCVLAWTLVVLSTVQNQGSPSPGGIPTSVIVAFITAIATFGGAYLMFRGETQDTANWLIVELRNEAKAARESAADCEESRQAQAEKIEVLEAQLRSLTRRVTAAEDRVAKYEDCGKIIQ